MAFEVFKPLATTILTGLTSWSSIADTLIGALKGPILAALTIKLMWQGLSAVRGVGGRMVFPEAIFASLRVTLVWWAALTAGSYSTNVMGFFLDLRSGLTALFVPGAGDGYIAIDQMMDNAITALGSIFLWADDADMIPAFLGMLAGLAMCTFMAIFGIVASVNMLFADLSLAFLFAIGPLFVACFAFQSTSRFFDSWLGSVLSCCMLAVLIAAVAGMAIGIMAGYATNLAAGVGELDFLTSTFAALGASGILIAFAAKAPSLVASLAGGINAAAMRLSQASGPIGAAMSAAGAAGRSMAGGAANLAAYGAGAAMSTPAGQALASSAPAQAVGSAVNAVAAAANTLTGSMGGAFAAGRGGSIAAGGGSGASARPMPQPAGSRSLPPVSQTSSRAAERMSLSA